MTINEIVKANEGLIYKLASKFYGVDHDDLYQAGVVGIMKAHKNYKNNGTTKFSSYAHDYIYGEMYALVEKQKQIKVSRDYLRLYKSIELTRYSLAQRYNRVPTNEEIALFLEKDIVVIEQAIQAASKVMSLDEGNENDRSIYETIPVNESISMDDRLAINESMDLLNEDEKKIIEYRYFEDLTQSEIAKKLNMTQVMVSRYEKKGINKMRAYYAQH